MKWSDLSVPAAILVLATSVGLAQSQTLNLKILNFRISSGREPSGNRAFDILVRTQQGGGRMVGQLEIYVQAKDASGTFYFGSMQNTQSDPIRRESARTESIYQISHGLMERPTITGVWVRYVNTGNPENFAEYKHRVTEQSLENWISKNADAQPLTIRRNHFTYTK